MWPFTYNTMNMIDPREVYFDKVEFTIDCGEFFKGEKLDIICVNLKEGIIYKPIFTTSKNLNLVRMARISVRED